MLAELHLKFLYMPHHAQNTHIFACINYFQTEVSLRGGASRFILWLRMALCVSYFMARILAASSGVSQGTTLSPFLSNIAAGSLAMMVKSAEANIGHFSVCK